MSKFIRNRKFRDEPRVVITVRAQTADRVVYHYFRDGQTAIGCVSRKFFDTHYRPVRHFVPKQQPAVAVAA